MRMLVALGAAAAGLYWFVAKPWHRCWGAHDDELSRVMPGDELVANADYQSTRAVTVEAGPEHIWPWLAQMGYGRGGLYSYDWLDILFGLLDRPSAREILPEFQHLTTGDMIPLRKGGNFLVRSAAANEHLVIGPEDTSVPITWATAFYTEGDGRTRLVTRVRARRRLREALSWLWLDISAFFMVRRWLLNLKGRAERLRSEELGTIKPALMDA